MGVAGTVLADSVAAAKRIEAWGEQGALHAATARGSPAGAGREPPAKAAPVRATRRVAVAVIIVEERFEPPMDLCKDSPVADKVSPCLPIYDVRWLSSYIASDSTRCVYVYDAKDAESVRRVYRSAGVDLVDVWSASPHHRCPDDDG